MKRLAVLGHPVAHSRSPAMQNAALAELGLGERWRYEAIDVAPAEFAARVAAMPGEGFVGANVTIPHKEAALALAAVPSEAARQIGAANTLSFGPAEHGPDAEGGIAAENTDAGGFLAALGRPPLDARALVLGAGGAARAVVWALVGEGARVEVWNRTADRAGALVAELGGALVADPGEREYDLIVNTSAVGLHGEDPFAELPIRREQIAAGTVVVDMVYGAEPTSLLRAAAERGAATVDGLEILVRQGALSLRIWTGLQPPLEAMRAAARQIA